MMFNLGGEASLDNSAGPAPATVLNDGSIVAGGRNLPTFKVWNKPIHSINNPPDTSLTHAINNTT